MKAPVDTRGPLVDAQRRHGEVMEKLEEIRRELKRAEKEKRDD